MEISLEDTLYTDQWRHDDLKYQWFYKSVVKYSQ
jgi:hypothetical protein